MLCLQQQCGREPWNCSLISCSGIGAGTVELQSDWFQGYWGRNYSTVVLLVLVVLRQELCDCSLNSSSSTGAGTVELQSDQLHQHWGRICGTGVWLATTTSSEELCTCGLMGTLPFEGRICGTVVCLVTLALRTQTVVWSGWLQWHWEQKLWNCGPFGYSRILSRNSQTVA